MTMTPSRSVIVTPVEANRLAAKVGADQYQCHLLYGLPDLDQIDQNQHELATFLREGLLVGYEFGFINPSRSRVVSWHYTLSETGQLVSDRPGGLTTTAAIDGAAHFNLIYPSQRFFELSDDERAPFLELTDMVRAPRTTPRDGLGAWCKDRTYVSGGFALGREEFRPFS